MSYQIGIDALNLRPTPRLAHTEYCTNAALKRVVTGLPESDPEQDREFYRQWSYDFIWSTDEGPEPWETRGRTTDMGHAEFLEGGVDRREPKRCPFAMPRTSWPSMPWPSTASPISIAWWPTMKTVISRPGALSRSGLYRRLLQLV